MEFRTGLKYGLSLIILLILLVHSSGIRPIPFLALLENQAYDLRLRLTAPNVVDPRVVIIDIDEKSLQQVGRWPWDRDVIAALIDNLFEYYGVQVVGFDVLFAEKDQDRGLDVMQQLADGPLKQNQDYQNILEAIRPQLQRDIIFSKSLAERATVLGYFFKNIGSHGQVDMHAGKLPAPALAESLPEYKDIPFITATGYGGNLPVLQQSASSGGFIDMPLIDSDGIIRKIPLVQRYKDQLYGSLSLNVVRALMGNPPLELTVTPGLDSNGINLGLEWIKFGGFNIPVDENGAVMVNFKGPFPSFPYVPAVDILTKKAPRETLEGTIVLLGTTAAGLLDMRSTPMQAVYPGVEVHANLIANILDEGFKESPSYTRGIDLVLILIVGLLLIFALPRLSLTFAFLFATAALAFVIGLNIYAWINLNMIFPVVSQVLCVVLLFVLHIFMQVFIENRSKRQLAKMFGQYVPPELVEEMSHNQEGFGLDGETREMTVLFSDIRGFTSMSESMEPKQLTQMMNEYLTEMTECVHKHRGTIDKYIGDALMSFWGAPLSDQEHARHALQSSLEMVKRLPILNKRFIEKGWKPIKIGIGLNTGNMNVGNMGSQFRMSYTVLGDAVNLGSRLESLTKRYGVEIIVSETVKTAVTDYQYRQLDLVRVVGKQEPICIYEPIDPELYANHIIQEELDVYKQALDKYHNQEWDEAKKLFTQLIVKYKGRILYQMYVGRCIHFIKEPPKSDWDGVYNFTTK